MYVMSNCTASDATSESARYDFSHGLLGLLVEPTDQVEQQLAAGLDERQIAEFVENQEVETSEAIGGAALPAGTGFGLQPVDQVDCSVEAATGAGADAGAGNGYGKMAFSGAGAADEHVVALVLEE